MEKKAEEEVEEKEKEKEKNDDDDEGEKDGEVLAPITRYLHRRHCIRLQH